MISRSCWCLIEIDGQEIIAIPSDVKIHFLSSIDFSSKYSISRSGHDNPINFIQWNKHGSCLITLSESHLIIHSPKKKQEKNYENIIWEISFKTSALSFKYLDFSDCTNSLIVGNANGFKVCDLNYDSNSVSYLIKSEWSISGLFKVDNATFSCSRFILATLCKAEKIVYIWRRSKDRETEQDDGFVQTDALEHEHEILEYHWKRNNYFQIINSSFDGYHSSPCFESTRMLFTLSKDNAIRIWVEKSKESIFQVFALIEPGFDLDRVCWMNKLPRRISKEKVHEDEIGFDWLVGIDTSGYMHLWKINEESSMNNLPLVVKTEYQLMITLDSFSTLKSISIAGLSVVGFFSQNVKGHPSSINIYIEQTDHFMLSYSVGVQDGLACPRILRKKWQRGHIGSIISLSCHPSYPVIVSFSHGNLLEYSDEIIVYWLPSSCLSNTPQLCPSGVWKTSVEHGHIQYVKWIPVSSSNTNIQFLVFYENGLMEVYNLAINESDNILRSPQKSYSQNKSPIHCPWTFYEETPDSAVIEYEVSVFPDVNAGVGMILDEVDNKIIVSKFKKHPVTKQELPAEKCGQIVISDELVGLNGKSLIGMHLPRVLKHVKAIEPGQPYNMRFRASSYMRESLATSITKDELQIRLSLSSDDNQGKTNENMLPDLEENILSQTFKSFINKNTSKNMFEGWIKLMESNFEPLRCVTMASILSLPSGMIKPQQILIFGISKKEEQSLLAYIGSYDSRNLYYIKQISVSGLDVGFHQRITTIASENTSRLDTFEPVNLDDNELGCTLMVGDSKNQIYYLKGQLKDECVFLDVLSSIEISSDSNKLEQKREPSRFDRYGHSFYCENDDINCTGIIHIEIGNCNRIATLCASSRSKLIICEFGSGKLYNEATIGDENGPPIFGFTWCEIHLQSQVGSLLVQYETEYCMYVYDCSNFSWPAIGDRISSNALTFDCMCDSSGLIIGTGERGFDTTHSFRKRKLNISHSLDEVPAILGSWSKMICFSSTSDNKKLSSSNGPLPEWHPKYLIAELFGVSDHSSSTHLSHDLDVYLNSLVDKMVDIAEQRYYYIAGCLKLLSMVLGDIRSLEKSISTGLLELYFDFTDSSLIYNTRSIINQLEEDHIKSHKSSRAEDIFKDFNDSKRKKNDITFILEKADIENIEKHITDEKGVNQQLFQTFSHDDVMLFRTILSFFSESHDIFQSMYHLKVDFSARTFMMGYMLANSARKKLLYSSEENKKNTEEKKFMNQDISESSMFFSCIPVENQLEIPSSSIFWALCSNHQQIITKELLASMSTWNDLGKMWPALWIKSTPTLMQTLESVARKSFAKHKDAMCVCLPYIALGKIQMLMQLAKISKTEANMNLSKFLDHDFSEERWSNAAIKNGYSLLSKKKYECAMAFFLLPNKPLLQEVIRICISRLQNLSLALLICRIVEYRLSIDSYSSEEFKLGKMAKNLIQEDLLKHFQEKRDVWLESCAYWWLSDRIAIKKSLLPLFHDIENDTMLNNENSHIPWKDFSLRRETRFCQYVDLLSLHTFCLYSFSQDRLSNSSEFINTTGKKNIQLVDSFLGYWLNAIGLHSHAVSLVIIARKITMKMLEERHGKENNMMSISSFNNLGYQLRLFSVFLHHTSVKRIANKLMLWIDCVINSEKSTTIDLSSFYQNIKSKINIYISSSSFESNVTRSIVLNSILFYFAPVATSHLLICSILLHEMERHEMLLAWLEYVSLDILYSCTSLATRDINEEIIIKLIRLIRELNLILYLGVTKVFELPDTLAVLISSAIRISCLVLAWVTDDHFLVEKVILESKDEESAKQRETTPMSKLYESNNLMIQEVLEMLIPLGMQIQIFNYNFGYNFLESIVLMLNRPDSNEIRSVFEHHNILDSFSTGKAHSFMKSVLTVQVLRTYYSRLQQLFSPYKLYLDTRSQNSSYPISQFIVPLHLWKDRLRRPLEGIRRWFMAIEGHLQDQLYLLSRHSPCFCGLYGLDNTALAFNLRKSRKRIASSNNNHQSINSNVIQSTENDSKLSESSISSSIRIKLSHSNKESLYLLMQHPEYGIERSHRHFRNDPRVHIKCFTFESAWKWLSEHDIFRNAVDARLFLIQLCKIRRLRLLIRRSNPNKSSISNVDLVAEPRELEEVFMFVNPWEIEASINLQTYMYSGKKQQLLELGWNCLRSFSSKTIVGNGQSPTSRKYLEQLLPRDDTRQLWNTVRGDSWVVSAVSQSHVDQSYVYISRKLIQDSIEKDAESCPYLEDVFTHVQRNRLYHFLGFPYRFIGILKVKLLEGRNLIPCNILSNSSEPYVFVEVGHSRKRPQSPNTWSIRTYRSRVGGGGLSPTWGENEDEFLYRFSLPVHKSHQDIDFFSHEELCTFYHQVFQGLGTVVNFTMFSKCKVRTHPFMGSARVSLHNLESKFPQERWFSLKGVASGELKISLSLHFELMSSILHEGSPDVHIEGVLSPGQFMPNEHHIHKLEAISMK